MKKIITFAIVMLGVAQVAFAQDKTDFRNEALQQRREIMKERQMQVQAQNPFAVRTQDPITEKGGGVTINALSAADVGDPDSFGKNAQFLGFATAGIIIFDPTCDPADIGVLGPDDRCIIVADPSVPVPATTFNDIGRITIPGKSVENIIYAIANHTQNVGFLNTTGGQVFSRFSFTPSITIESVALSDPSLIDPNTGQPFNGAFTTTGFGSRSTFKPLPGGAQEIETNSYSRANTPGFSRVFFQALGLPNNVINQLYKKPMTIRLNVRVSSQWVQFGTIAYGIRFLGN
jgi:hypothetical protein